MSKLSAEELALLNSISESLMAMSGRYGARTIGDTEERTKLQVYSISIGGDDTAFTTLVCTNGTDTLSDAFFLGGAATPKAGRLWAAPPGFRFTTIELSAGEIEITGPNITGVITPP